MSVRMKRYKPAVLLLGALGVATGTGCGSEETEYTSQTVARPTGELSLSLQVDPGLGIDAFRYQISGNGESLSGSLPVGGAVAQFSATIPEIPVGSHYALHLSSKTGDPSVGCAGTASFDIVRSAVTVVDVTLACDELDSASSLTPNGPFNVCPSINGTTVMPPVQAVGANIALSAMARDVDLGPMPLSFVWSTPAGTLANARTANPTFTCTQPGTVEIQLEVSDGPCSKRDTVSAVCTASVLDGGADVGLGDAGRDAGGRADAGVVGAHAADAGAHVADTSTHAADPVNTGAHPASTGTHAVDPPNAGTGPVDFGGSPAGPVVDAGENGGHAADAGVDAGEGGSQPDVVDGGGSELDPGASAPDAGMQSGGRRHSSGSRARSRAEGWSDEG